MLSLAECPLCVSPETGTFSHLGHLSLTTILHCPLLGWKRGRTLPRVTACTYVHGRARKKTRLGKPVPSPHPANSSGHCWSPSLAGLGGGSGLEVNLNPTWWERKTCRWRIMEHRCLWAPEKTPLRSHEILHLKRILNDGSHRGSAS